MKLQEVADTAEVSEHAKGRLAVSAK